MTDSKLTKKIIFPSILIILLFTISLATHYMGSTDVGDYAGVAKFFAGKLNADLRTSHSLVYGLLHSPFLALFDNYVVMKITSLLFLTLIIISVYHISNKDKKTLYLMLLSPIVWYIGPWVNPLQLASLLFLWAFHFINQYQGNGNKKYLISSGLLVGLSAIMWNTILFVAVFFAICFFYNKNINHFIIFIISFIIGISPLLIIDQILYGFALNSTLKFLSGLGVILFDGGIYDGAVQKASLLIDYLTLLVIVPLFSYKLVTKKIFLRNKRQITFIFMLILFFLLNPQIRYLIFIVPLLTIYLGKALNEKEFKIQLIIFALISAIVISPYIVQTKYSTNSEEFNSLFQNIGKAKLEQIKEISYKDSLESIIEETGKQTFVVGNNPDDYYELAHYYWGNEIKEFVSIQDYQLWERNESVLYSKRFEVNPRIEDRRKIWLEGGISKSDTDDTEYSEIEYAIGIGEEVDIRGFELLERYGNLYLSKKQ